MSSSGFSSRARKAQAGLLWVIFSLIMFFILYALYLGSWVNQVASDFVTNNSLTGIEAFLAANLNLWIWVGVILGFMGYLYFGGNR